MDIECPLCNKEQESLIHLFWQCHYAKQLWFSSCWGICCDAFDFPSLTSCFLSLIDGVVVPKEVPNFDEVLIFASICLEKIMQQRNEVVHGGTLKQINVDAATHPLFAVSAGIARNDQGEIIAAFSNRWQCTHPLVAEVRAIQSAIHVASARKWEPVILESDCKEAVEYLTGSVESLPWIIVELVQECRAMISKFRFIEIALIPRVVNFLAHNLASWAANTCNFGELDTCNLPSCIWNNH
ncbi:Ribonuclease H-like domain containing protein [Trema orientale]|uniref:Ribonuclease H-like domain containing protein n=1 Tax=Trema orientale TaxID=63057 RepID=A0A2P5ELD7_TREOI|nr:Ribonuclease H-like domain containing protein [Trema orientale]